MPSGLRIFRQQRTTQPQGPAQARVSLGFTGLWLGSTNVNLAAQAAPGVLSNGTAIGAGPRGLAYVKTASAAGSSQTASLLSADKLPLQGATVVIAGAPSSNDQAGHFGVSAGVAGQRFGAHFGYGGDGTLYFDFGGFSAGATRLSFATGGFSDSDIWVLSTGARGMEIWRNGRLVASNGANPTRTASLSTSSWGLGPQESWATTGIQVGAQRWYAFGLLPYQATSALASQMSVSHASLYAAALEPQPLQIWVPSAAGGTTISVPAASLTLTGIAPAVTATANIAIAVPAAALTLTSFAPTVLQSQMVQVPAAALTLTPYAPTVAATANQFINPPAAALTLTGYAPSVVSGGSASISVPAAGLTLTGYVPTVTAGASALIAVPAGALTLTGFAPAVVLGTTVAVPAGSLTLTSFAPSVVTTTGSYVDVPAAALALTGYAPSVSNGVSSIPTMPPYITVYMWKRTA